MELLGKIHCDGCGVTIEDDEEISRTFYMGISGTEDRCLGSSGVDILQKENEAYNMLDKCFASFRYDAEAAIGDLNCVFCGDCCADPEGIAVLFEHKIRETRSRIVVEEAKLRIENKSADDERKRPPNFRVAPRCRNCAHSKGERWFCQGKELVVNCKSCGHSSKSRISI